MKFRVSHKMRLKEFPTCKDLTTALKNRIRDGKDLCKNCQEKAGNQTVGPIEIIVISLISKELDAYSKAGAVAEEALSSAQEKEIQSKGHNGGEECTARAACWQLPVGQHSSDGSGVTAAVETHTHDTTVEWRVALRKSQERWGRSYCIGSAAPHLETFTIARGAVLNIFQVIDKAFKYSSPYCKKEPKRQTHSFHSNLSGRLVMG
ncbi:hypothetical protein ACRRTK_017881 [Alexandromys fortis]